MDHISKLENLDFKMQSLKTSNYNSRQLPLVVEFFM